MLDLYANYPTTLEDAISVIVSTLDEEEHHFINMNGAESLHFSTGMAIRNAWIHPEGALLKKHFIDRFGHPLHADDMSEMILKGVTARVQKIDFDPIAVATSAHNYWIRNGITTGESL